jgi:NDP-sugar pyrophosphorylase family protein
MKDNHPIFCILSAGTGSRLGELTKEVNKALLPVMDKPVISHIIDLVPEEYEIVIATGYKADSLKDYIISSYPNREIKFVYVSNFDGEGSGPATSLLACEELLIRPFYLTTVDTIVNFYPSPTNINWIGIKSINDPENFCTIKYKDDNVIDLCNKEKDGYEDAFIGLTYIHDHVFFFQRLKENFKNDKENPFIYAFYKPEEWPNLKVEKFDIWYDTGTIENYKTTCLMLERENSRILKKIPKDNFTYFNHNQVIKFTSNREKCSIRKERYNFIKDLSPELKTSGNYTQIFPYIVGSTLYELDKEELYNKFFYWCKLLLWEKKSLSYKGNDFEEVCRNFYRNKTINRIQSYKESKMILPNFINKKSILPVEKLLEELDWKFLSKGIPVPFHGDLQFDNAIYDTNERFFLIDWREEFGGILSHGDIYYEFAKLYGGININYRNIRLEDYHVSYEGDNWSIAHHPGIALENYKKVFEESVIGMGYSMEKVKILTSLVWLSMSPIHPNSIGDLFYAKGAELLQEVI